MAEPRYIRSELPNFNEQAQVDEVNIDDAEPVLIYGARFEYRFSKTANRKIVYMIGMVDLLPVNTSYIVAVDRKRSLVKTCNTIYLAVDRV